MAGCSEKLALAELSVVYKNMNIELNQCVVS